jgi:hypothetical protein
MQCWVYFSKFPTVFFSNIFNSRIQNQHGYIKCCLFYNFSQSNKALDRVKEDSISKQRIYVESENESLLYIKKMLNK